MSARNDLRARIAADLQPVRPLLRPWQRALLFVPAAGLAWLAAPGLLGIRSDIQEIGPWLSWGASIAQLALAVALVYAALREAVPAAAISSAAARGLLAAGACVPALLALATHAASPEPIPRAETFDVWFYCWRGALLAGVPLVGLLGVLLARGLAFRPPLAGGLAGLGAGSAVDGGWRLYCNYSSPAHVLLSHGGAVLALALLGVAAGVTIGRLRHISRKED